MFEGEFLEEKKYKGTEKEYDRVGTLIFSGEHKNGNKFLEPNIIKILFMKELYLKENLIKNIKEKNIIIMEN